MRTHLFLNTRGSRRGFTLVEIGIAVLVIGILVALASVVYLKTIAKSEDSEALVNLAAIKRAEVNKQAEAGTFVNASDTSEVNEKLDSGEIQEKIFRYKVVNATKEDFVAIAERITDGSKITTKDKPIEIAMYADGSLSYTYPSSTVTSGSGYGLGGTSYAGTAYGGGGGSGSGGFGVPGGFSGGGVSGGAGGGSGGGLAGSSGGTGFGTISGGGASVVDVSVQVVDPALSGALSALKTSTLGETLYDLIYGKSISVIYEAMGGGVLAYWSLSENKIAINSLLRDWTNEALAAEIAHEATHADYTYNGDKWVAETLERHSELSEGDLHIVTYPYYSLDQEYMANYQQVDVWKALKGTQSNLVLDEKEVRIDQGEDFTKAYLRTIPSYAGLPEY